MKMKMVADHGIVLDPRMHTRVISACVAHLVLHPPSSRNRGSQQYCQKYIVKSQLGDDGYNSFN